MSVLVSGSLARSLALVAALGLGPMGCITGRARLVHSVGEARVARVRVAAEDRVAAPPEARERLWRHGPGRVVGVPAGFREEVEGEVVEHDDGVQVTDMLPLGIGVGLLGAALALFFGMLGGTGGVE